MSAAILLYEPDTPADARSYADGISREFPALKILVAGAIEDALARASEVSVIVAKAQDITPALIAGAPRLRWIQALTTGVDPIRSLGLASSVIVTSARGVHGPQMAELTLLTMLSLSRNFPRMVLNQSQSRWQRWGQPLLAGKTAAIVGVGTISETVAARCKSFGLKVIGITNRDRAEGFDELYPRAHLCAVAARADFLVLLTPYSPETHHLVDARVLASMPPTGFLINIARGKIVDESALIEVLRTQRIAGAALDVFDTEPLPASSPLWKMGNVIITPHIGGMSDIYAEQMLPLLLHNLRAFLAGDPAAMRNSVI